MASKHHLLMRETKSVAAHGRIFKVMSIDVAHNSSCCFQAFGGRLAPAIKASFINKVNVWKALGCGRCSRVCLRTRDDRTVTRIPASF